MHARRLRQDTLLADWATNTEWPVAWLSLDPDENDPARFWRYSDRRLGRGLLRLPCRSRGDPTLPPSWTRSPEPTATCWTT